MKSPKNNTKTHRKVDGFLVYPWMSNTNNLWLMLIVQEEKGGVSIYLAAPFPS